MPAYAELQITSNFSFLRGASHPEELVVQAQALGLAGLALTDRNSFAGIVRAHQQAKETGLRFLVGCRLDLVCGTSLLCWPTDKPAYARLSSLLTHGKLRAAKAGCSLTLEDVLAHDEGQVFALLPPDTPDAAFAELARRLRRRWRQLYLVLSHRYAGDDAERLARLAELASRHRRPAARDQRRPLPPPRPPAAAGRGHLHPRACADRRGGALAVRQRRAPPQAARGDGPPVPRPPAGARE